MKVYVDKIPKKCEDCYFYKNNRCLFDNADCPFDRNIITFDSLADYTKQVRKEVLDKLSIFLISTFSKDAEFSVEEILNWFQEVKNQIQGETK